MGIKYLFSTVAILLTFIAFVPYIGTILSGKTKPHVFSWVIWGTTTMIVFFAQLEAKGGVGAWPIGVSACLTLFIAFLAFVKRSDIKITYSDSLFFLGGGSLNPCRPTGFWAYNMTFLMTKTFSFLRCL
jgi:hypothetical protein